MPVLVIVYIGIVFFLHLVPMGPVALDTFTLGPLRGDYLLHSLVFIPWMPLLIIRPLHRPAPFPRNWRLTIRPVNPGMILAWLLLGTLLAISAELLHLWLPYRSFNPLDAIFNALGITLGLPFLYILRHTRR